MDDQREGVSAPFFLAAGVAGMDERRAGILLDRPATASGAAEDAGTYTGVLVEAA